MTRVYLPLLLVGLIILPGKLLADNSLFKALGGREGVNNIAGRFIYEIGEDAVIREYFAETDLDRFYEKFSEQLCQISGGGCSYSGDTMIESHTNMDVNEADFNRTVDLLINAMEYHHIPHPVQNRLLKQLAPMRADIIYR